GEPFRPGQYLGWGSDGVEDGDVVFVVGNPGPTSRLQTIAQLEYTRDVQGPATVDALQSRLDAMQAFYENNRALGDSMDIRNQMFGLSNSLKAWGGRVAALRDDDILARKRVFERAFRDSIRADDDLRETYGTVIDSIARLQQQKRALGDRMGAFFMLNNGLAGSRTLQRAIAAQQMIEARSAGVSDDSLATLRNRVLAMSDRPAALELALLAEQLGDFRTYLGSRPELSQIPRGTDDVANARELLARTVFADSARTAAALAAGDVPANDPALRLIAQLLPLQRSYATEANRIATAERAFAERLGRARFEVYGTTLAPDATFSPRITDGVVSGYPANGTMMPPYTTFYGMYERHYAHEPSVDWALPDRFLPIPQELDLGTPLNFASTADTYGGNSGSPAITPELELVGLNFDRNVEGLSRDFIYLPERGRNVMVDSRAILEALDDIYDADHIVAELLTGRLDVRDAETVRQ
ncbi:MAG TPA: S46 family peptidase, partial [Longimicrobiales bacterium]